MRAPAWPKWGRTGACNGALNGRFRKAGQASLGPQWVDSRNWRSNSATLNPQPTVTRVSIRDAPRYFSRSTPVRAGTFL